MKYIIHTRTIALLTFFSLVCALFVQHGLGYQPCAWCILQRVIYLAILVVALLGTIAPSILLRLSFYLISALSLSGIAAGMYQFMVAGESYSCTLSFADRFINQYTKLSSYFPEFFGIYASCASKAKIFGIDLSLVSVAGFISFLLISLIGLQLHKRQ